MTLTKLKKTEQILLAVVVTTLVLGLYTYFRFIPKNDAIGLAQRQTIKTESKLFSASIPNEPEQDVDDLLAELDEQEQSLAITQEMAEDIEQHLAPFGSQQLKVMISELARNSGVQIRTNEAYQPPQKNTTKIKKSKKSRRSKKSKRSKASVVQAETAVILPSNFSWIKRMSAKTLFHRPLQRIVLDGDYQSIRRFISGLETLQWQVTVVQLSINKLPITPLSGYAQKLRSELILAL